MIKTKKFLAIYRHPPATSGYDCREYFRREDVRGDDKTPQSMLNMGIRLLDVIEIEVDALGDRVDLSTLISDSDELLFPIELISDAVSLCESEIEKYEFKLYGKIDKARCENLIYLITEYKRIMKVITDKRDQINAELLKTNLSDFTDCLEKFNDPTL